MHDDSRDSADIRIGDAARYQAMERLGNFFADGYLDVDEFNERTEAAAVARTQTELQQLFKDLPADGTVPAATGSTSEATGTGGSVLSPLTSGDRTPVELHNAADQELQHLLDKGKKLKVIDGLATTVGILTIVLLMTGVMASYAWVGFILAGLVSIGGRFLLNLDDDEEELLEELAEQEAENRAKRLRIAAEKRREIEQRGRLTD